MGDRLGGMLNLGTGRLVKTTLLSAAADKAPP